MERDYPYRKLAIRPIGLTFSGSLADDVHVNDVRTQRQRQAVLTFLDLVSISPTRI